MSYINTCKINTKKNKQNMNPLQSKWDKDVPYVHRSYAEFSSDVTSRYLICNNCKWVNWYRAPSIKK